MPTEYPLGKARKAQLAAKRREHQVRSKRRIIQYMPFIIDALHTSKLARNVRHDERTGMVSFKWFGRSVNYSVGKMTMLVYGGLSETAVYSHYTAQQLIDALTYSGSLDVQSQFFDIRKDVRLYEGEIKGT